jgi:hypothetical protein
MRDENTMFGDMPLATAAAPTPYSRISPQPTIQATLHDADSKYQIASLAGCQADAILVTTSGALHAVECFFL